MFFGEEYGTELVHKISTVPKIGIMDRISDERPEYGTELGRQKWYKVTESHWKSENSVASPS